MINTVLDSAEFIAKHSKDVTVNLDAIDTASESLLTSMQSLHYSRKEWSSHPLHPKGPNAADSIFLMDLLNFSFWKSRSTCRKFAVNGYTGYWSLCAALKRASDEGVDVFNAQWYDC